MARDKDIPSVASIVAGTTVETAIASGVVLAGGGPLAVALGGAALVGYRLAERYDRVRWLIVGKMIQGSADEAGLSVEQVDQWATEDPDRFGLISDAIQAASTTFDEDKVRALGRVLASGISEDARVGEATLLVRALASLEAPHIAVLRVLTTETAPSWEEQTGERQNDETAQLYAGRWGLRGLQQEMPEFAAVLAPVEMTLRTMGITARTEDAIGQPDDVLLTSFGALCVEYLKRPRPC